MDTSIVCFMHCNSKIFSINLAKCPKCDIPVSDLPELPFRIPYPFVRAKQHRCSVVMKPTIGNFLEDYKNSDDLHIGITDCKGSVWEYDADGLRNQDTDHWNQAMLVYEVPKVWHEHWDFTLEEIQKENRWSKENYNEESHNCYNFVLEFLKRLGNKELKDYLDKENFVRKFIIPKGTTAASFIEIYRKLKLENYFVVDL